MFEFLPELLKYCDNSAASNVRDVGGILLFSGIYDTGFASLGRFWRHGQ
jgi:hypothetical protein